MSDDSECVMFGPEVSDGRMIPVRCVDSRCFQVARCALGERRCPVLTESNLGAVLSWLNKSGLGRSSYRLVPSGAPPADIGKAE